MYCTVAVLKGFHLFGKLLPHWNPAMLRVDEEDELLSGLLILNINKLSYSLLRRDDQASS